MTAVVVLINDLQEQLDRVSVSVLVLLGVTRARAAAEYPEIECGVAGSGVGVRGSEN